MANLPPNAKRSRGRPADPSTLARRDECIWVARTLIFAARDAGLSLDEVENSLADAMTGTEDQAVFGNIERAAPRDNLRGTKGVVLAGLANGSRVLASWAAIQALVDAGDRIGLKISEERELASCGQAYRAQIEEPWATATDTLSYGPFVFTARQAVKWRARINNAQALCGLGALNSPATESGAWARAEKAFARRGKAQRQCLSPGARLAQTWHTTSAETA